MFNFNSIVFSGQCIWVVLSVLAVLVVWQTNKYQDKLLELTTGWTLLKIFRATLVAGRSLVCSCSPVFWETQPRPPKLCRLNYSADLRTDVCDPEPPRCMSHSYTDQYGCVSVCNRHEENNMDNIYCVPLAWTPSDTQCNHQRDSNILKSRSFDELISCSNTIDYCCP